MNKIKVLVVDDIADTGSQISKLLAFEPDMEVVGVASSGQEALELATSVLPDVVLLDINMPDMDGIETAERLTRQAPSAAIVMMSVNGEADYVRRAMLAGARAYLIKPFSSDELFSMVRDVYRSPSGQCRARARWSRQCGIGRHERHGQPSTRRLLLTQGWRRNDNAGGQHAP